MTTRTLSIVSLIMWGVALLCAVLTSVLYAVEGKSGYALWWVAISALDALNVYFAARSLRRRSVGGDA